MNMLRSTNREEMQVFIQSYFQEIKTAKIESLDYQDIRSTIDNP